MSIKRILSESDLANFELTSGLERTVVFLFASLGAGLRNIDMRFD